MFANSSERIRGRRQSRGQDVERCIEEGTAGGHHGPSRRPIRRMHSIRGESQEQILKADEALRKVQDERCKLEQELREGEQRLEELRAEASELVRAPPAAPTSGDEVSNLKKLVSELRGQVVVLEENKHDNWEGVEELRRLRREVEDFRRARNEARTSKLSTELAIPGSMNLSTRMAL